MLKHKLVSAALLASTVMSVSAYALQFGKPITVTVPTNTETLTGTPIEKQVVLMNIELSPQERTNLLSYQPTPFDFKVRTRSSDLPTTIDLGMNKVPVLDQGRHGTCVTFATTAAIDAVLGKGDFVSPLCSLQLGKYLADSSYYPDGWDGSMGPIVLDQFMRFGMVNLRKQKAVSCGGLKDYPTEEEDTPEGHMTLKEYKAASTDLNPKLYWVQLMSHWSRAQKSFVKEDGIEHVVQQIKQTLSDGSRLTFGTFIVIPPNVSKTCVVGACAKYKAKADTWALTSELNDPNSKVGGHEMVITGYDDKAVAIDNDGKKHQGLFFLRNSWGSDVGDNGNFYMTYDYFKKFATEAQVVASR